MTQSIAAVITPTLKPVGGIVKIFDYADHLRSLGYLLTILAGDEWEADLPLFRGARFADLKPSDEVIYKSLQPRHLSQADLVLFSWPTHYRDLVSWLPPEFERRKIIHLVQNVRHANPNWIGGYATRLLTRPMSRVFVASPVLDRASPFLNTRCASIVIPEGHRWEYFRLSRHWEPKTETRVGYTTWKSDIGRRVQDELATDDRYEFIAVTKPVGWPELREFYHSIDIFLATPFAEEGFYLPALEAMAAGALVITPDAGGNMEYCSFGVNCLEADLDDTNSYRKALETALLDHEQAANLITAGYKTVLSHTLDAERSRFADFVADLQS